MMALANILSLGFLIWTARVGADFLPINAARVLVASAMIFETMAFSFSAPILGLGREKPGFLRCFSFLAAGFALTGCVLTALIFA